MGINLSKLVNRFDGVYPFDGKIVNHDLNERLKEFKIVSPIFYKGKIVRTKGSDTIDIDIKYEYKTNCDRCLKDVVKEAKALLSGELRDSTEEGKLENESENDDTVDVLYHDRGNFKLHENIVMEVASSLPMKTLCSRDCKGLCSQCGADLNKESCDCSDNIIDPRLEKLREINIKD